MVETIQLAGHGHHGAVISVSRGDISSRRVNWHGWFTRWSDDALKFAKCKYHGLDSIADRERERKSVCVCASRVGEGAWISPVRGVAAN